MPTPSEVREIASEPGRAAEELHWRIHMKGWLPWGLGFARAYHMSHHDTPNTHYNVFLPLFDFLLGNSRLPNDIVAPLK